MKQQGISLAGRLNRASDPVTRDEATGSKNAGYGMRRLGIASVDAEEPAGPPREFPQAMPPLAASPTWSEPPQAAEPSEDLSVADYQAVTSLLEAAIAVLRGVYEAAVEKFGGRKRLALAGIGCAVAVIGLLFLCSGGDGPLKARTAAGNDYSFRDPVKTTAGAHPIAGTPAGTSRGQGGTGFESTKSARAALLYGNDGDGEREIVIQPRMAPPSTESPAPGHSGRAAAGQDAMAGHEVASAASGDGKAQPNVEKRYCPCPQGLTLSGVVRCPEGLLANISGRFLPVGGTINNAVVVDIKDYSVEMEIEGRRFLLGMNAPAPPPVQADSKAEAEGDSKDDNKADADQPSDQDRDASKAKPAGGKSDRNGAKRPAARETDHK